MHIDFETEHPVGISGMTTQKYAEECRVLCMVYDKKIWLPDMEVPKEIIEHASIGGMFYAHNAAFERNIWRQHLVPAGFPPIPDEQWYCTAAACRTLGIPASLENAGLFLDLKVLKGDSKIMKKLSKAGNHGWDDYARLYEYCKQDVRAETALSRVVRPLQEHPLWCYTERINDRGIPIDVDLATAAANLWKDYSADLNRQFKDKTGFRANQTAEVLKLFKGFGLDVEELSKQTLDRLDVGRYGELVRLRREASQSAPTKFKSLVRNQSNGRIHSLLIFHGARTGRWTGAVFQPQNLMRGCVPAEWVPAMRTMILNQDIDSIQMAFDSPAEAIGSMVRPCIRADKLICCDFAAIEARGSAWMANCKSMITAFKEKKDVYVEMAKAIYGKSDIGKTERFFGKTAVLGCNYGLGAKAFREQCDGYGVQISLEFARSIVQIYRRTYPEIQAWWYQLEEAFQDVVIGVSKRVEVGPLVVYRRDKQWVCIKLPSGRDLSYMNPRIDNEGSITFDGYNNAGKKWAERTWGGKLTENAVSGMCRDIMVEAMYRLERHGYEVILTVHDEILCEGKPHQSAEEMRQIMCGTVPEWASGLPIDGEAWEGEFYRK